MADPAALLIGVDGGATSCKLTLVERLSTGRLRAGARSVAQDWEGVPGFEPLPMERQLEQHARAELELSAEERAEGRAWVNTLANVVGQATFGVPTSGVVLGVCMPGWKTADGRGIAVMRHGPRMPAFLDDLERELAGRNLTLAAPLTRVHSDGEAAGWGEEAAASGAFGGVRSAYYVGSGTGVCEALKLDGAFVGASELRELLPPPWSARRGDGVWEDALSMPGLGGSLAMAVDHSAKAGDRAAQERLTRWACALGDFVAERLELLALDRRAVDRVVVGQRAGLLVADEVLAPWARRPLEEALERGVRDRQDESMRARVLEGDRLVPGFLVASTLREAASLGVVAAALELVPGRRGA